MRPSGHLVPIWISRMRYGLTVPDVFDEPLAGIVWIKVIS